MSRPSGVMLCTLPLHFLRCIFFYYQIQSKLNFVSTFFGYLSLFWDSLYYMYRQPCVLREILRSPMAQILKHEILAAKHLSLYEKSEFYQLFKGKKLLPGCFQNTALVLAICYMYFPHIQDVNNAMCILVILFLLSSSLLLCCFLPSS